MSEIDKSPSFDPRAARRLERKKAKKRKKELKKLRREQRKRARTVPKDERAIICPPSGSDLGSAGVITGLILRAAVAYAATLALTLFVCDALGYLELGLSFPSLALWIALICASLTALCLGNLPVKLGGAAALLATVALRILPIGVQRLYGALALAYNSALDRMVSAGFLAMGSHAVTVPQNAPDTVLSISLAAFAFATVAALIYIPCTLRRVRLIPPLILTAGVLVPIFIYNLTKGNWGVALVIASCASLIVIRAYDKRFIKPRKDGKTDSEYPLLEKTDEPPLPEKIAERNLTAAERKAKRKQKKEQRKKEKENETVSLDDELSDYFSGGRKKAKKASPKAKNEEKRTQKAQIRAYLHHKRHLANKKSAVGGFAGALTFCLAMLILVIPASTAVGRFTPISSIDNTLQYYRKYITAVLVGDDPALDSLAYDSETQNFAPRDTEATPRVYQDIPIMRLYTNVGYNTYLRGWIGVDYKDGKWHTPNSKDELLKEYRSLFGTDYDPAETLRYNFYDYFFPSAFNLNTQKDISALTPWGTVISKLAIERYNLSTMNLYFPAYTVRKFNPTVLVNDEFYSALMPTWGNQTSGTTYADYFDGVYTSYGIREKNEDFSVVAMISTMRNPEAASNLARSIAELNDLRTVIGAGVTRLTGNDYPNLIVLGDGTRIRYKTYTDNGIKYVSVLDGDRVHTYHRNMWGVTLFAPGSPMLHTAVEYFEFMTYAERSYYDEMFARIDDYTRFVYSTYSTPSDSPIFAEMLNAIAAEAGIDVSLAAKACKYNLKTDAFISAPSEMQVYLDRHALAMAIIDYLSENYAYTLDPVTTESETFGVEKFLTETKEGYCVQFASALTLMLRAAGIPARYTEGYIAHDFDHTGSKDGAYYADVLDRDEHAWVEVWFDGIGWVQYEATPIYYDDMYRQSFTPPSGEGSGDAPDLPPVKDDPEEPTPPEEPEEPEDTPSDIIEDKQDAAHRRLIARIAAISLATLALLTVFFLFIFIVYRKASKAAKEREKLLKKLEDASKNIAPPPERQEVRTVNAMLFTLLEECGLAPEAGQFGGDLAASIAKDLEGVLSKAVREEELNEYAAEHTRLGESELRRIFAAIAAEEFGYGAPTADLYLIARFYRRLYAHVYRKRVSALRRCWLWLVKRKI